MIAKDSENWNESSFNTVSLTRLRTASPATSTQAMPEANKATSDDPNDPIVLMSKKPSTVTPRNIFKDLNIGHYERLLSNDNAIAENTGKQIPTSAQLMTRGFGRPDLNHQFASAAHFEHVILFVFKSEYSNKEDTSALCRTHPLIKHLWVSYNRLKNFDFTSLSLYNTSFEKQQQIPFSRIMKFTAAALHYNFHIPSVIRYIGNNYTAAFRDVKKVLNRVKDIVPPHICKDLERIFKTGAPRYMVAESSRDNFLTYW